MPTLNRGPGRALVVIDVLSSYDHEDAERLVESAAEAVPRIARLLERARAGSIPIVYVNDASGDWTGDRRALVERARSGRRPDLIDPIAPHEDAAMIVKGRHSVFWETQLEYMLAELDVGHLVFCGQATEQCVLYSALDAHIRHFDVTVVRDACAHIDADLAKAAFEMMERNLHAELVDADEAFAAG